jgi:hypothetical protein
MVPIGNTGRRKGDGNHSPPKTKVVQDLERNVSNKTIINKLYQGNNK